MARTVRILLVDDIGEVRQTMRTMLELEEDFEIVGEAADGSTAVARALEAEPDVVLMDVNLPGLDGVQATHQILERLATRVIMVSVESDREYFRKAMQAGARDFLVKPFSPDRLSEAIRQAMNGDALSGAGTVPALPRILTVAGARGGAGSTLIAAQLAASLARLQDERVILIEAAPGFATLPAFFDRRPLSGWLEAGGGLQQEQLESLLLPTAVANLFLLPGAGEGRALAPRSDTLTRVVAQLAEQRGFLVVDVGLPYHTSLAELLKWSERLVFLTVPEIPGLQLTNQLLLQLGEGLGGKLEVWLNRSTPGGIETDSVERALAAPLTAEIGWDEKALHRINLGRPFAEGNGGSPLAAVASQALARWGFESKDEAKPAPAGSRLAGIFGWR